MPQQYDDIGLREGFTRRDRIRCEDCDLRGNLDAAPGIDVTATNIDDDQGVPGKVVDWEAVGRCETCRGRGYVVVTGIDRLDPYARRS